MSDVNQQGSGVKVKGVADIVFCFDCTGSMQPCIDQVKANVEAFVSSIDGTSGQVTCNWRVKVIGYRDFNTDSEKIINTLPFVSDAAEFKNQLSKLTAEGGGDEPESTFDAMWHVVKDTDWREKCHRILVLFTDATPLPVHQDTIDKFTIMGDQEFLMQEMVSEKIKLFLFAKDCEPYQDMQMVEKAVVKLFDDPTTKFQSSDFDEVLVALNKTISETVSMPVL